MRSYGSRGRTAFAERDSRRADTCYPPAPALWEGGYMIPCRLSAGAVKILELMRAFGGPRDRDGAAEDQRSVLRRPEIQVRPLRVQARGRGGRGK